MITSETAMVGPTQPGSVSACSGSMGFSDVPGGTSVSAEPT